MLFGLDESLSSEGARVGLVRRLEHLAGNLAGVLESDTARAQRLTTRMDQLARVGNEPFPRKQELADLRSRLIAVDAALHLSEDDDVAIAEDPRIDGEQLARVLPWLDEGRLGQMKMCTGDVVTGIGKTGLWEVVDAGVGSRHVRKVGAGEGSETVKLDYSKPYPLISRRVDQLTAMEARVLAAPETDRISTNAREIAQGDRVTFVEIGRASCRERVF